VPGAPANLPPIASGAGFTLRTTTRLVDVGVVASDKKGHPVTDLKPTEFEIYDNGRKQEVRYFSQAAGAVPGQPSEVSGPPAEGQNRTAGTEDPSGFSNRHSSAADGKKAGTTAESNATIILLDGRNLAFGDLTYARTETMRFLQALPAGERVALYAIKFSGFQILTEETTDHALLEAKLGQWMPSAQDLANAQDEEQRNRQQIDEVHNISDLSSVNGNNTNEPNAQSHGLDPQLRDFGANPARDSLAILVSVARHLAALPGHKDLVWISSDNVLADWNKQSVSIEKGSKFIEPFALRAQEAMNDAHVSVYPLDASQLEAGTIDASIRHRNVELTPAELDKAEMMGKTGSSSGLEGQDIAVGRDMRPGRVIAEMQQNLHAIQGPIRELAEATGGRIFRRSGSVAAELNGVVADGHAAYLLSFTPDLPADDKYHLLTVKVIGRRDIILRYRTGYEYDKEPTTLKDRFRKAVWQPADAAEIGLSAKTVPLSKGATLKLNIATPDLGLAQQGEFWAGKIDVFLVERDDAGLHAKVTGQTLSLKLKPATYWRLMRDGIPIEQSMEIRPDSGSVRVVVVDESSGRMGSVTIPASQFVSEAKKQ
jgi:VWFA-related protein